MSSPSKSARKLAWVPVVPLTPRNLSSADPLFDLAQVEDQLWHQSVARLPTVTSWAG